MYNKKAHLHFVGIGGIGMSGIAKVLRYQGYTISGCDLDMKQMSITELKELGCAISHGHNTAICQDQSIDILVYSSAVKTTNPELLAAQTRGIPTIPRALMLAELMRTKYSVAIAGSHGKTTTTSMISHVLIEAGLDPTIIIGGHLKNISAHARLGKGDFLVAEADESDRSLLNLQATMAVLTNIDLEHLETYTDLDDVKATFTRFLNNLPFYGKAFLCIDDPNIQSILPIAHLKTIKYGFSQELADLFATNVILNVDHSTCVVATKQGELGPIIIPMPGRHNVLNALATCALARELGVTFDMITQALASFKGVERRFSYKGTFAGAELFDDYGHHPVEIKNTLEVARKRTQGNLTVVFQPHRYSRTHKLWEQFIDMFLESNIDHLIITDIYAASEAPIAEITGENFVKAIRQRNPRFTIHYAPYEETFHEIKKILTQLARQNDLILLQGAGKINQLAEDLGT
ncbi:UDP-N-acetylmuramate--L-alanine ligase [Candidatus Babeliales bacterium]|nr:UDP-N-acetylmuramate--L-alanine ligase [Candidatus Babeliales bacterium]